MAQESLYVIGIGGTGAKCLEAIIQAAAVGLFTDGPIKVLFVDADETNGNLERARRSLSLYQGCYQHLKGEQRQCAWMQTPITSYLPDIWSPFGKTSLNKNLDSFYGYNNLTQNHPELGNLFNVLFTSEERKADLDVGFRGRPAIGAAIMSQLDLDNLQDEPWASFIQQIKTDAGTGKSPKIFLCGSIFGGTGAAGLPTLGRLLHNKLGEDKENVRAKVKIACLFVLPYFGFSQPTGNEATDEVYARADQFLLNTEAALRYYSDQHEAFDHIYLLGNQNFSNYSFSLGKNTQRNEPHFIELYAALAARHFLLNAPDAKSTVILNSRQDKGQLVWSDLPEMTAVQQELVNGARFAYIWLTDFLPELRQAQKGISSFQKAAPWFVEFFRPSQGFLGGFLDKKGSSLPDFSDRLQQEALDDITAWCRDYLRWLYEMHNCDGDEIQLFRYKTFANLNTPSQAEYLSQLVMGDSREQGLKQQDTVQQLKERLSTIELTPPNQGMAGLAKALYILCRL